MKNTDQIKQVIIQTLFMGTTHIGIKIEHLLNNIFMVLNR